MVAPGILRLYTELAEIALPSGSESQRLDYAVNQLNLRLRRIAEEIGRLDITAKVLAKLQLVQPPPAVGEILDLEFVSSESFWTAFTSLDRQITQAFLDRTPPATPAGIVVTTGATILGDGTIQAFINVVWNRNDEADLWFYQINYMDSNSEILTIDKVNGTAPTMVSRLEPARANTVYKINIRAVDKQGNFSAPSGTTTITSANADSTAPGIPTSVTVTPGFQLNVIQWVPPTDVDWDVTEIWRSTSNDSSTATKAGEHRGIMFFDGKLGNATTYYYWLRARDTSGNLSGFHTTQFAGTPGTTLRVVTDDIAAAAVDALQLKDGAVTTSKLANLTVTNIKVAVGVIEKTRMNWNTHLIY